MNSQCLSWWHLKELYPFIFAHSIVDIEFTSKYMWHWSQCCTLQKSDINSKAMPFKLWGGLHKELRWTYDERQKAQVSLQGEMKKIKMIHSYTGLCAPNQYQETQLPLSIYLNSLLCSPFPSRSQHPTISLCQTEASCLVFLKKGRERKLSHLFLHHFFFFDFFQLTVSATFLTHPPALLQW